MTSARRLYRLYLAVAAAGVAALAAALAAVVHAVTPAPASIERWLEACGQMLLPSLTASTISVLAVMAAALGVVVCGLRSLARQLRASRRYVRARCAWPTSYSRGTLWMFDDPRPHAFCAGYLRPRIYLSTGARIALPEPELEAVLAHERHHARRRDPLRILLARAVADGLFFVPALKQLAARYAELAELAADEAAFAQTRDRRPLASALLVFGERDSPPSVVGVTPERVDHLLGEPPRWRVPRWVMAASAAIVIGLVAIPAAATAMGGPVDLPMLAARSCMLIMAAGGVAVLLYAGVASRSRLSRR